ncbi:hypothetical protein [Methylotuvimicrobium alcaliphilum]|uniref:DUF1640 domain-containing protein n=1 Tax=Methylotuvimicrobium alcaliphilum (strain DSM 19304 / NCIMB 14124 / VKM B-2133 / 20Z) TaxID=1091494 RepID=G4T3X2_META2|nr:hypothetical protein [Methylotuvimicrobium alcaliphilum]CCE22671.1 conserved protein of unknown function [Methylotuvimicrobium alcaliphilum 20Z]
MALAAQDIEQIEAIVLRVLAERTESKSGTVRYDLELRERFVRVEEELKHQRELMLEGFKQMEKRFEQVDKRFEQVDKRFEQVDKRFEQVDKRFEQVDKRFEQLDKRFEVMQLEMNKRFEQVDKRFEQQHHEIMVLHQEIKVLMRWGFGALIGLSGLIVGLFRLMV